MRNPLIETTYFLMCRKDSFLLPFHSGKSLWRDRDKSQIAERKWGWKDTSPIYLKHPRSRHLLLFGASLKGKESCNKKPVAILSG